MLEEFCNKLIAHAKRSVAAAPNCLNEQAAKISLVLPFLATIGYDALNPSEVCPEHGADFSDKYKNRVDYAILKDGEPITAIECKKVGAKLKDDHGQLKAYFNAAPSVKMGVLTDGIVFEFYADSENPNVMDPSPFLRINLEDIASGKVEQSALQALSELQKSTFNPENIGAQARQKLVFNSVVQQITEWFSTPPQDVVKLLLRSSANIKHTRAGVIESEYVPLVQRAFDEAINQEILRRVGFPKATRAAIFETRASDPAIDEQTEGTVPIPAKTREERIVTTERELEFFDYVRRRLAYLVKDENEFVALEDLKYQDQVTKFSIFYKSRNKGRIVDFYDTDSCIWRVQFGTEAREDVESLISIDAKLVEHFRKAVAKMS